MQIEQLLSILRIVTITAGILAAIPAIIAICIASRKSLQEAKKVISEAPPPEPKPRREKPPKKEIPPKPEKPAKQKPKPAPQKPAVSPEAAKPAKKEKPPKEKKTKTQTEKVQQKPKTGEKPAKKGFSQKSFFGKKKAVAAPPEPPPVVPAKRRVVRQLMPDGSMDKLHSLFYVPSADSFDGWHIFDTPSITPEPSPAPQKGDEEHESI